MIEKRSIAFDAGKDAKLRGEKLKTSALKNIRPGCKQYDDFIAGFDSTKQVECGGRGRGNDIICVIET